MFKIVQKIILTGTSKFISEVRFQSGTGNFAPLQSSGRQTDSRGMGAREVNRLA
jgi:hypothetical protein